MMLFEDKDGDYPLQLATWKPDEKKKIALHGMKT